MATGQAMLQWTEYQHVIGHRSSYAAVERIPGTSLATGQAMLQWTEYQHVIGHRSSYAAVEKIPGTSLATGQAMLQWKKYQARHWPQVKLCCSGKNTSTCATETAHWADKVLPKTCKMGHKVQPQQNVSHGGMVKMRIARVNMAS